jgi:hypothetical protein
MPIDFQYLPAIRFPIMTDVLGHHFGDYSIDLEPIVVNDGHQVIQFVFDGKASCFTDHSLLLFSISHQNIYLIWNMFEFWKPRPSRILLRALSQIAS